MMPQHNAPKPRPFIHFLLIAAGCLALVLGIIGIALPGLPTTPFILLAAFCFAKASPRLHARLLGHKYLGPMVRDWEAHHTLPLRIKVYAAGMMGAMVLLSIWGMAGRPWVQGSIALLGLIGAGVVWRIPTRR